MFVGVVMGFLMKILDPPYRVNPVLKSVKLVLGSIMANVLHAMQIITYSQHRTTSHVYPHVHKVHGKTVLLTNVRCAMKHAKTAYLVPLATVYSASMGPTPRMARASATRGT